MAKVEENKNANPGFFKRAGKRIGSFFKGIGRFFLNMKHELKKVTWPTKMPNKKDFQKRMAQFFDHYLKGAPMPKWMAEGVPAVDQPFELGY